MTSTVPSKRSPERVGAGSLPHRIAFYLPQFFPIPENDAWHGSGFTEWSTVARSRPLFPGHAQPDLPGELGFYDLRVPETRERQAQLARDHGISGFCYYHYWFEGTRMLERVFDEVLESGKPDFPFCLAWANESWYRRWNGANDELVIKQAYSEDDDREHIRWLLRAFKDDRYIRIKGRPLLCVYLPNGLPDSKRTMEIWLEECERASEEMPWVVGFETYAGSFDPSELGMDATAEFVPHGILNLVEPKEVHRDGKLLYRLFDYEEVATAYSSRPDDGHLRYPCVATSWDNSPRRQHGGAFILANSSVGSYGAWLGRALASQARSEGGDGIVFVNAWNEWAEGAHLEPSELHGRGYLEETRRQVESLGWEPPAHEILDEGSAEHRNFEDLYLDLYEKFVRLQRQFSDVAGLVERQSGFVLRDLEDENRRLSMDLTVLAERCRTLEARAKNQA